ncbi:MAG: hypothetical protein FJ087_14155 [Deltaproteobacteria bacterium]|nr:hypothetical protein [Deltaproteobacteria bacterium]
MPSCETSASEKKCIQASGWSKQRCMPGQPRGASSGREEADGPAVGASGEAGGTAGGAASAPSAPATSSMPRSPRRFARLSRNDSSAG